MEGMRNRIIFPVRDEYGKLVGMGARRLCDEDTSKFRNISTRRQPTGMTKGYLCTDSTVRWR